MRNRREHLENQKSELELFINRNGTAAIVNERSKIVQDFNDICVDTSHMDFANFRKQTMDYSIKFYGMINFTTSMTTKMENEDENPIFFQLISLWGRLASHELQYIIVRI